jgi:hypothetical protein
LRRLGTLLFPPQPRHFPGRRAVKVGLRAAHVLSVAGLVGAFVFHVEEVRRDPWLHASLATGALVLLIDLHESAAFLLQVRGVVVLIKLALLAALPALGANAQVWVLSGLVVVSVVFSHAPSEVRHRLLVGAGRIRGGQSRG